MVLGHYRGKTHTVHAGAMSGGVHGVAGGSVRVVMAPGLPYGSTETFALRNVRLDLLSGAIRIAFADGLQTFKMCTGGTWVLLRTVLYNVRDCEWPLICPLT